MITSARDQVPPIRRIAGWGILVMLVVGCLAPRSASAHAELIETEPASGAHLNAAPGSVTLTFNESVQIVDGGMQLFGDDGASTLLEPTSRDAVVTIPLPPDLDDGNWLVTWRVISADGHPISGVVQFSVGAATGADLSAEVAPSSHRDVETATGIVQGIAYLAILLGTGFLLVGQWIGEPQRRADAIVLAIAGPLAILAQLALIPLAFVRQTARPLSDAVQGHSWNLGTDNPQAVAWYLTLIGFAVLVPVLGLPRLPGRFVALGGALVVMESAPVVGHTRSVDPRWLMVSSDLLHVLAAAMWSGGLLAVVLTIRRAYRGRSAGSASMAADIVSRFSTVAAWIVALVAVAGVLMAWRILGAWEPLFHTTWGGLLLVKLGLALVPIALAAWNRYRLVPRVRSAPDDRIAWFALGKSVVAELIVIVAIIGVTGFLVMKSPRLETSVAPVATPSATVPATPGTTPFASTVPLGDGRVDLTLTPAQRGSNRVTLTFTDADGNPITLVDDPVLRIALEEQNIGPLEFPLTATSEPGVYEGTIDIPANGKWTFSVNARISEFEAPGATWQVMIPNPATPVAMTDDHVGIDPRSLPVLRHSRRYRPDRPEGDS